MSRDGTVYWDYSYAFAHGIGVYAVIVSTKSNFRLQPACSFSVHCQQRPVLAVNVGLFMSCRVLARRSRRG